MERYWERRNKPENSLFRFFSLQNYILLNSLKYARKIHFIWRKTQRLYFKINFQQIKYFDLRKFQKISNTHLY